MLFRADVSGKGGGAKYDYSKIAFGPLQLYYLYGVVYLLLRQLRDLFNSWHYWLGEYWQTVYQFAQSSFCTNPKVESSRFLPLLP